MRFNLNKSLFSFNKAPKRHKPAGFTILPILPSKLGCACAPRRPGLPKLPKLAGFAK